MRGEVPLLSGQEIVNALQRIGYYVRRQKGSHVRFYHPERLPVTVPAHQEVDRRTFWFVTFFKEVKNNPVPIFSIASPERNLKIITPSKNAK